MPSGVYPRKSLEERFWGKVQKTSGCWLWTGSCRSDGYGEVWVDGRRRRAHIVSYELINGPVPSGKELDHKPTCPKRCVRLDHLRPATRKQNAENRAGAQKNNLSGIRGVSWNARDKKWFGRVQHNGKVYCTSYWLTAEAAGIAAAELRNQLFTHNDLDRL